MGMGKLLKEDLSLLAESKVAHLAERWAKARVAGGRVAAPATLRFARLGPGARWLERWSLGLAR